MNIRNIHDRKNINELIGGISSLDRVDNPKKQNYQIS